MLFVLIAAEAIKRFPLLSLGVFPTSGDSKQRGGLLWGISTAQARGQGLQAARSLVEAEMSNQVPSAALQQVPLALQHVHKEMSSHLIPNPGIEATGSHHRGWLSSNHRMVGAGRNP